MREVENALDRVSCGVPSRYGTRVSAMCRLYYLFSLNIHFSSSHFFGTRDHYIFGGAIGLGLITFLFYFGQLGDIKIEADNLSVDCRTLGIRPCSKESGTRCVPYAPNWRGKVSHDRP